MKIANLDHDVLFSLYGDCRESMNEVFSEFLSSYHTLKDNLSSAFESGDLPALKKMLHFHGPSFMYIGLPDVAAMFKNLEKACVNAENNFQVYTDYTALQLAVEESYAAVSNETAVYSKAV